MPSDSDSPKRRLPVVEIRPSRINGEGLFALRAFKAGDTVCTAMGEISSSRTRISIELNANEHFEPTGMVGGSINALAKLNHACNPNACVRHDSKSGFLAVEALTGISAGEEITIDYRATETELAHPFVCNCDACRQHDRKA